MNVSNKWHLNSNIPSHTEGPPLSVSEHLGRESHWTASVVVTISSDENADGQADAITSTVWSLEARYVRIECPDQYHVGNLVATL